MLKFWKQMMNVFYPSGSSEEGKWRGWNCEDLDASRFNILIEIPAHDENSSVGVAKLSEKGGAQM